jgi:hypothetical protein
LGTSRVDARNAEARKESDAVEPVGQAFALSLDASPIPASVGSLIGLLLDIAKRNRQRNNDEQFPPLA